MTQRSLSMVAALLAVVAVTCVRASISPGASGPRSASVGSVASPTDLRLAPTAAGVLVVGAINPDTAPRSSKDRSDPGRPVLLPWWCQAECVRVPLPMATPDPLAIAGDGDGVLAAVSRSGSGAVVRCVRAMCRETGTSLSVPDRLVGLSADGADLVVARGTQTLTVDHCTPLGCGGQPGAAVAGTWPWQPDEVALASRDGRLVLVHSQDADTIAVMSCADLACRTVQRQLTVTGIGEPQPLAVHLQRDGRAVILANRHLLTCTDPTCASISPVELPVTGRGAVIAALTLSRAGLPMLAVLDIASDVWLYRCADSGCSQVSVRKASSRDVSAMRPPREARGARLAVAEGPDGTVHIAWLTRTTMVLLRCDAADCA